MACSRMNLTFAYITNLQYFFVLCKHERKISIALIYALLLLLLLSSVGIATDYELDGPGSNPGRDEILRPSRPALGPTQPPVKWLPVLSQG